MPKNDAIISGFDLAERTLGRFYLSTFRQKSTSCAVRRTLPRHSPIRAAGWDLPPSGDLYLKKKKALQISPDFSSRLEEPPLTPTSGFNPEHAWSCALAGERSPGPRCLYRRVLRRSVQRRTSGGPPRSPHDDVDHRDTGAIIEVN